jgi:hypothetical protein
MRVLARIIAAVFGVLAFHPDCEAALIRYDFTTSKSRPTTSGDVRTLPPFFEGGDKNHRMEGHFVVDTSLLTMTSDDSLSGLNSVVAFDLHSPRLSGRRFTTAARPDWPRNYAYFVNAPTYSELTLSVNLTGPGYYATASLSLLDNDGSFSDEILPIGEIDLSSLAWGYTYFGIIEYAELPIFPGKVHERAVSGRLTSLTGSVVSVPEPRMLVLIGPALLGLFAARWRRRY